MVLRHSFLSARTSQRSASDPRSSPRALCLLHPDLRVGERWDAGDVAPRVAAPTAAQLVAWLGMCRVERGKLRPRLVLRRASEELRLCDDLDLPRDEQALLIALWSRRDHMTHFQRLGIAPTGDVAAIRRAYLETCRRLHPDRYFGKRIGPFAAALAELFARARAAYEALIDPRRRTRYLVRLVEAGHRVEGIDADAAL